MLTLVAHKLAYVQQQVEDMGERLRRCRLTAKLTQKEIGEAAGVSGSAVAQWESGDTKSMKPDHLFRVARVLRVSPEWLATGRGPERPQEFLYELIEDLPDTQQQQAFDFIQYLVDRGESAIGRDKIARYHALIEDFQRDMAARRSRKS